MGFNCRLLQAGGAFSLKQKTPLSNVGWGVAIKTIKSLGNDLLSQAVTHQVPTALTGLTNGFGMCPGVPLSLQSPRDSINMLRYQPNSNLLLRVRFSR